MHRSNDTMSEKNELFVRIFFIIGLIFIIIFIFFMFYRANWFFLCNTYITYYKYGNDLKTNTIVTLNGIKVGEVKKVIIDEQNRIKVSFTVTKKYTNKIKEDSVAKIVRPLLIGNKQINISTGSLSSKILAPGSVLRSEDSSELIDLVSGVSLQEFVDKIGFNPENIADDMFKDVSVRELYDQAITSLLTLNEFQKSMKDMANSLYGFADSINNMSENMRYMGDSMSSMSELSHSMEDMGDGLNNMSSRFEMLSKSMNEFTPLSDKLEPMLDKLDILLEALQRNALFKRDVEKIKKEKNQ